MGLSSEMTDCIRTGLCPRCSQENITPVGSMAGTEVLISAAEDLLVHRPKLVGHSFRDGAHNVGEWLRYWGPLFSDRPVPGAGWLDPPPQYQYSQGTFEITRGGKHASKRAAELFLVKVFLGGDNGPAANGPWMTCNLCGQGWLVGEWKPESVVEMARQWKPESDVEIARQLRERESFSTRHETDGHVFFTRHETDSNVGDPPPEP
jgi:hypothetical protein